MKPPLPLDHCMSRFHCELSVVSTRLEISRMNDLVPESSNGVYVLKQRVGQHIQEFEQVANKADRKVPPSEVLSAISIDSLPTLFKIAV